MPGSCQIVDNGGSCDLELRGAGLGVVLLFLPGFLPSVISSLFTQITGGGSAGIPGSSPRSATPQDKP